MVVSQPCGGPVHIQKSPLDLLQFNVSSCCGGQPAFCGGLSSPPQDSLW